MPRNIPEELIEELVAPIGFSAEINVDGELVGFQDRTTSYPLLVIPFLPRLKNLSPEESTSKKKPEQQPNSLEVIPL